MFRKPLSIFTSCSTAGSNLADLRGGRSWPPRLSTIQKVLKKADLLFMDNVKIILVSDAASPMRVQIPFMLSQHPQYEILSADKEIGLAQRLQSMESDIVVFDAPVLGKYELVVIHEILKLKPTARLVVLADHITIFSYKQISKFKNSIAIQKPLHPAIFLSILEKAADKAEDLTPVRSPRFIINEAVRIVTEKSGLVVPTRMRNYSAGGAFLEYHGISLRVGDRLRMRMNKAGNLGEQLEIKAKVVWLRDGDGREASAAASAFNS